MGVPEDAVDKTERVSTDCPPVVLIVFNRPDLTEQVFAAVRQARPRQLLVVADGPRDTHPADVDLCAATRAAVAEVDWPCDVLRRYSERNLGCGPAVSGGIGWALDQVGEALILEDDCLPDHSLFAFCAELLDRYRSDDRVMQIAGHNWAAPSDGYLGYSYAFNAFSPIWGWATWRRAWEKYDFHMRTWPQFRESGMLRGLPSITEKYKDHLSRHVEGCQDNACHHQIEGHGRSAPVGGGVEVFLFGPGSRKEERRPDRHHGFA